MSIKFLKDIKEKDLVGGKGASLAKMLQNGFNIPNGFVIEADMFNEFLIKNNIKDKIQNLINKCSIDDEEKIDGISKKIISILDKCNISDDLVDDIIYSYEKLNCK